MIIKTITCHDVYNYGASLQAFALMKYLENLGHEVEIIDYKPDYLDKRYKLFAVSSRYKRNIFLAFIYLLIKIPMRFFYRSRKYAFDRFTRSYLKITPQRYKHYAELKENPPYADIYFAGSDQIWNTLYANGRDSAFYLDFTPKNSIKASYAASFGTDQILNDYIEFVREKIDALDYIAVRERTGIEILNYLGISRGVQVLDPVFLLDKEAWSGIMLESIKESYILVYDFENNPLIEACSKRMKEETGLKIIAVNDWIENPYADVNIKDAGPEKFLTLIAQSEFFLSNSFHGTAFSVIFEKQFYSFKRIRDKVNSRIVDFLNLLGLQDQLINSVEEIDIKKKINYNKSFIRLNPLILKSKKFIDSVLKEKESMYSCSNDCL
jgi:hypothetical protein